MSFSEFYQRSINEPEQFWAEQARRIDWQTPFTQTLDHSNPPFARWFCEGRTNLCHNAIDRWLEKQPEALALIAVSSETEEERTFTFRQLHDEVNAVASMLRSLGVQRDVGGYAVALATSMDTIFGGKAGGVFFCASDIGWVVGHSYIVYAPLLAGMATIVYEGLPTWPDCGVWWKIVEKYQVSRMFSAPTAIRVLKKFPTAEIRKHDLSSLEVLYLAGEPLDEPTASWVSNTLDVPVIDNYWQTESGWPIMAIARGLDDRPTRLGSPGVPMYGYNVQLLNEVTGEPCGVNEKGMLVVEGPLPPGCIQTIWGDDDRFVKTYWSLFSRPVYATFDWGIRDADGYHFILGRTDDVINVAGHRLGTREIEESISSHPGVAEVAVVGVKDALKGQVAVAFVIPKESDSLEDREVAHSQEKAIMALVDSQIGNFGRPAHVWFVSQLPKTRSGKMLRRTIQAICEGRDPGDLTTIDDPASLDQIRQAMEE
ncbi:AMP-binding protein [Escherichia coli]|uniref:AMP-binding protein n=1 Tax=Escherichia coli TaxID=562 RepID=UPI000BE559FF|nr:AMP-binding protein [Escherichia coli]